MYSVGDLSAVWLLGIAGGLERVSTPKTRCEWALGHDLLIEYHDHEWGVPVHGDRDLFEFLTLEGAQAGLSWLTVLKKRNGYRELFDNFEVSKVAAYDEAKVADLMLDARIIRNRLKIESTISNARAFLEVREEYGSFDTFIWGLVGEKPQSNRWQALADLPAKTQVSDTMSRELKKRGFRFVGSTICYAFMQATGMVNDHVGDCFRYRQVLRG